MIRLINKVYRAKSLANTSKSRGYLKTFHDCKHYLLENTLPRCDQILPLFLFLTSHSSLSFMGMLKTKERFNLCIGLRFLIPPPHIIIQMQTEFIKIYHP